MRISKPTTNEYMSAFFPRLPLMSLNHNVNVSLSRIRCHITGRIHFQNWLDALFEVHMAASAMAEYPAGTHRLLGVEK